MKGLMFNVRPFLLQAIKPVCYFCLRAGKSGVSLRDCSFGGRKEGGKPKFFPRASLVKPALRFQQSTLKNGSPYG